MTIDVYMSTMQEIKGLEYCVRKYNFKSIKKFMKLGGIMPWQLGDLSQILHDTDDEFIAFYLDALNKYQFIEKYDVVSMGKLQSLFNDLPKDLKTFNKNCFYTAKANTLPAIFRLISDARPDLEVKTKSKFVSVTHKFDADALLTIRDPDLFIYKLSMIIIRGKDDLDLFILTDIPFAQSVWKCLKLSNLVTLRLLFGIMNTAVADYDVICNDYVEVERNNATMNKIFHAFMLNIDLFKRIKDDSIKTVKYTKEQFEAFQHIDPNRTTETVRRYATIFDDVRLDVYLKYYQSVTKDFEPVYVTYTRAKSLKCPEACLWLYNMNVLKIKDYMPGDFKYRLGPKESIDDIPVKVYWDYILGKDIRSVETTSSKNLYVLGKSYELHKWTVDSMRYSFPALHQYGLLTLDHDFCVKKLRSDRQFVTFLYNIIGHKQMHDMFKVYCDSIEYNAELCNIMPKDKVYALINCDSNNRFHARKQSNVPVTWYSHAGILALWKGYPTVFRDTDIYSDDIPENVVSKVKCSYAFMQKIWGVCFRDDHVLSDVIIECNN